jgi:hypothetical protein
VTASLATATAGEPGIYTAGTCANGLSAFFGGSRLLFALDLGKATPLGGVLTVTTCGHSANNTVLYAGTGCPTWGVPFACVVGNDNSAEQVCGGNALASTLTLTTTQSTYYIQLGGYAGVPVVSGLGWSYAPPLPSATSSRTARSRSATATSSRTRKAK